MRDAVILSAVRLPTGRFQGALSSFTAPQLGALAVREAVRRAGVDAGAVDECILGNVVSAGLGQAPARQAALHGGTNRTARLGQAMRNSARPWSALELYALLGQPDLIRERGGTTMVLYL